MMLVRRALGRSHLDAPPPMALESKPLNHGGKSDGPVVSVMVVM